MRLNLLRHSRERGNPAFLYCCGRKLDPRFRGGDARWAVFIFLFFAVSAHAQNLVTSPRPDHVAVTVYRDPNRAAAQAPNLSFLNGYALISETRAVSLPAGESELRFEGVAGGILRHHPNISRMSVSTSFTDRQQATWNVRHASRINLVNAMARRAIELVKPNWMKTREEVIAGLPVDLLRLCSWCRYPRRLTYEPCYNCPTCRTTMPYLRGEVPANRNGSLEPA